MPTPAAISLAKPLVARFEGCVLHAYRCPADKLTIGYGHTGPDVKAGMVIDQRRAEELLDADLAKAAADVDRIVGPLTGPLASHRKAALISFVFNLGGGAFAGGTLDDLVRRGQWDAAAAKFMAYNKVRNPKTGALEPSDGLTKRRAAERAMFEGCA